MTDNLTSNEESPYARADTKQQGLLLVNLGTPASPSVTDVRRYLHEFLMDKHVISLPWPLRKLLVCAFILPTRPKNSAAAYAKIWTDAGSPLLIYGEGLRDAVKAKTGLPCELAMRYGTPQIGQAIQALVDQQVEELIVVPLYPHHADSTRTTSIEAVVKALPEQISVTIVEPFYQQPKYIQALAASVRQHQPENTDHLLMSYHGLPEAHLTSADPTGSHCLANDNCCEQDSVAHATCYRHQVRRTSTLLAAELNLREADYTVSFQSRLGRQRWLHPYTDTTLAALGAQGVKNLAVVCPAFVADNLETLEEINIAGAEIFRAAGGTSLTLIPCLNTDKAWVRALSSWCLL